MVGLKLKFDQSFGVLPNPQKALSLFFMTHVRFSHRTTTTSTLVGSFLERDNLASLGFPLWISVNTISVSNMQEHLTPQKSLYSCF